MENKTNDGLGDFFNWVIWGLIFLLIWLTSRKPKKRYVTTRKALSKLYQVDLKTFNKWVQIFSEPTIITYHSFVKQRGITQKQNDYFLELFGLLTEYKRFLF